MTISAKRILGVVIVFSILFNFVTLVPVKAANLDITDLKIKAANGIVYYDSRPRCTYPVIPEDGLGSYVIGSLSTILTSVQENFVRQHYATAQKLSIAYGIPWETVVAQGILESSSGTSSLAINKHNYFGIGAFDGCPSCAYSYATEEEGWQGYYENIRKTSAYRNHGVFQGNTVTDPYAYLVAIKEANYASDPNYVEKVSKIISAIEELSASNGWASSAELAKANPEWIANADANSNGSSSAAAVATYTSMDASVCIDTGEYVLYDGSDFPFFSQTDPQWSSSAYGTSTIGESGCGPTSFAMMATALTGRYISPVETAMKAGNAGMYVDGVGSSWEITKTLAAEYGLGYKDLASYSASDAINKINDALRNGWMIHTSGQGSSPFSSGGHYIGIRGITADGKWLIADSGKNGKEHTLERAYDPAEIISAGLALGNIKAIK